MNDLANRYRNAPRQRTPAHVDRAVLAHAVRRARGTQRQGSSKPFFASIAVCCLVAGSVFLLRPQPAGIVLTGTAESLGDTTDFSLRTQNDTGGVSAVRKTMGQGAGNLLSAERSGVAGASEVAQSEPGNSPPGYLPLAPVNTAESLDQSAGRIPVGASVARALDKFDPATPVLAEISSRGQPLKPVQSDVFVSEQWLHSRPPGRFTIQVAASPDRFFLERFAREQQLPQPRAILLLDGEYRLFAGDYHSFDAATESLTMFNRAALEYSPWVRKFQTVQSLSRKAR